MEKPTNKIPSQVARTGNSLSSQSSTAGQLPNPNFLWSFQRQDRLLFSN